VFWDAVYRGISIRFVKFSSSRGLLFPVNGISVAGKYSRGEVECKSTTRLEVVVEGSRRDHLLEDDPYPLSPR
jgi:hypothetical protein